MADVFDFISNERVQIPQGGDYPAGITGRWLAAVRYKFLVEGKPNEFGLNPDNSRETGGGYYSCYYADQDKAVEEAKGIGQQYPPGQVWLFEAPISTVLLPDESKKNFGASVAMDCKVRTLQSRKYRHEFHLVALPSAVQAYAQLKGWCEGDFDLSELTSRDVSVTDELSARLIGGEYGSPDGMQTIPYTESKLWQRRVALWKALGEDDPKLSAPIGYGRNETTSQQLSAALSIAYNNWAAPIWARVAMISDPRVDAVANSGNRLTIPALLQLYRNEEEAREASGGTTEEATETAPAPPPIPNDWKGAKDAWVTALQAFKAEIGSPPVPVARVRLQEMEEAGTLKGKLAATAEEVVSWWGLV